MDEYLQLTVTVSDSGVKDILIARLDVLGFTGFEETDTLLKAFVPSNAYESENVKQVMDACNVAYTVCKVVPQNWNALWESNFEPVVVDDFCRIRADFHSPGHDAAHEIIITPKMSFGTGHHATTFLMIRQMSQINFAGKQVADFGTGTGVLAILAEKMGASYVWAIDYDDLCIVNAAENIAENNCTQISIEKTDRFIAAQSFEVVLANINKNIIIGNIGELAAGTAKDGYLIISGLLTADEDDILAAAGKNNLVHLNTLEKDNWISIAMQKRTA